MIEKKLVSGSSSKCIAEIKSIVVDYTDCSVKKVTCFYENSNFLITEYAVLSQSVHLILEFDDGRELQIEGANCGYGGEGPHATISILQMFSLESDLLPSMIFLNDAVSFTVHNNEIETHSIDYTLLFIPSIRYNTNNIRHRNLIVSNRNVQVDLPTGEIFFYNPQRNSFLGFINLLSYLGDIDFEYYIGDNSPLANYYRVSRRELNQRDIDTKGTSQVNLSLTGENLTINCLIDNQEVLPAIEAIYLIITSQLLKDNNEHRQYLRTHSNFWRYFAKPNNEFINRVFIEKQVLVDNHRRGFNHDT